MSVGLIVDTVSEVIDIPKSNIEPAPRVNNKSGSRYIQGLGKVEDNVKILLDTRKLLFEEEIEQISDSLVA
jgi:purine-binding chemotaxis protein CheW